MVELKPCPFCGGKAYLEKMGWPHHVFCIKCGAKTTSTAWAEDGEQEAIEKWNRREELLKEQSQWISVKDQMPKTEQKVLVSIKTAYGNRYTTVAAHIGYHERNSESDGWSLESEIDWEEYDEENDWYWVPECWYEVNFVDDNPNWIIDKIDGEITHWLPLPEAPKEVE